MDKNHVCEGYNLMMEYMTENRIKTKHRNFIRRLERFYKTNKNKDLVGKEEMKYLELEKYFFINVAPPQNDEQRNMVEVLKIISSKR